VLEAFGVKVPLFVAVPFIVNVYAPIVKVAPEYIVILLQAASAVAMLGEKVVPEGIITLVDDVGTEPQPQFADAFQSVLVPPCHIPDRHEPAFNTPVAAAK